MTIALVTDSTCNIPADLARECHIHVTPLYVIWGDTSLKDGVDILEPEFYARLASSNEIPKTSQASPQDFVILFEKARKAENADEVICPVVSSDLSGTYASAMQAKAMVDFPVHVIDTRQVSWGLGHVLLAAAEARDGGASAAEIVQTVTETATRQMLLFTIESLDFLRRGGRIGNAKRLMGTMLRMQPVLEIREGIVHPVDTVRTRKRALEQLLKVADVRGNVRHVNRLSVIHAEAKHDAKMLLDEAIEKLVPLETHFTYATTVIGVHTGPGAVGLICEWGS
ncbi:MAG TPA: DegV family protein [Aggregatilineaceae bacterium]|nr:DegV family protein [Aggregatilineaceae bacterium]